MSVLGSLLVLALVAPPTTTVSVDSAKREVTITAGPFSIRNMPPGMDHGAMHEMGGHTTPFLQFTWPVAGWIRGYKISLTGADGRELDRRIVHHINVMNLDRRMLLYPEVERIMAAGQETEDVVAPKTIGIPVTAGYRFGMYSAWHNETGADIEGAYLKVTFLWSPPNMAPRPKNALPILFDAGPRAPGKTDGYDLPPGSSTRTAEFTMPIGGRLLGVGGHLHDYGKQLVLEDAESGKAIIVLKGKLTPEGRLLGVERKLYGVSGDGLALKANRKYRIRVDYENPTGKLITEGAMGLIAGIFTPDDMAQWPKLDPNDPDILADVAALEMLGEDAGDHDHGEHDHDAGAASAPAAGHDHGAPAKPAAEEHQHGADQAEHADHGDHAGMDHAAMHKDKDGKGKEGMSCPMMKPDAECAKKCGAEGKSAEACATACAKECPMMKEKKAKAAPKP